MKGDEPYMMKLHGKEIWKVSWFRKLTRKLQEQLQKDA